MLVGHERIDHWGYKMGSIRTTTTALSQPSCTPPADIGLRFGGLRALGLGSGRGTTYPSSQNTSHKVLGVGFRV